MEGWSWAIVGVGLFIAFQAFKHAMQVRVLLRARAHPPVYDLRRLAITSDPVEPEAGPEPELDHLRPFEAFVVEQLAPLGFSLAGAAYGHDATAWYAGWHFVLRHDDGVTWALARPTGIPQQRVMLLYFTLFDEGAFAEVTVQNGDLRHIPSTACWRVGLTFEPSWADALAIHRRVVEPSVNGGHAPWSVDAPTTLERFGALEWSAWEEAARTGWATAADDAEMRLTGRGVRRAYSEVAGLLAKLRVCAAGTVAESPPASPELVAELHLARERHLARAEPRVFIWALSLTSVAAFAVSVLVLWDVTLVPALVVTLAIHELGHWTAMRLFGYQNARIFFIPFLGAATVGVRKDPKLWQEVLVLLAGPLPGLGIGTALVAMALVNASAGWLLELGGVMVALNALNLLPFFPLDGGRIVQRLLHIDSTWLDVGLRAVASVAFGLGAVAFGDYVLGLLAVFGLVGLPSAYRVGVLTRALRADGAQRLDEAPRLVAVHTALLASPAIAKQGLVARVNLAKQIEERLRRPPEPLSTRLPWMLAYGALLAVPFVGGAGLVAAAALAGSLWSDVSTYACTASGAPSSSVPDGWSAPGIVTYRCEPMNDDVEALLDVHPDRSYCGRAPWEGPPADPAAVARTEAALAAFEAAVNQSEAASSAVDDAAWERAVRAAAEGVQATHPDIDAALVTAFVGAETGDGEASRAISERLGAGPSCLDGSARVVGLNGDSLIIHHGAPGVAPRMVLDWLCHAGCERVGARRIGSERR